MKELHIFPLGSNHRKDLIKKCVELQRKGKRYLYLLPSREAMADVRERIMVENKGLIDSKVIMFDELEQLVIKHKADMSKAIDEETSLMIIDEVCISLTEDLEYYSQISNKQGFTKEIYSIIKELKRNNVLPQDLDEIINNNNWDDILIKKLRDLHNIYSTYQKKLEKNEFHDIDDISHLAVEYSIDSPFLANIDLIIIDGFLNIDPVNVKLIEIIDQHHNIHIISSVPFKTNFTHKTIEKHIGQKLKDVDFQIIEHNEYPQLEEDENIKQLTNMLFTSNRSDYLKDKAIDNIRIFNYPCIEAEIRETSQDDKEKTNEWHKGK